MTCGLPPLSSWGAPWCPKMIIGGALFSFSELLFGSNRPCTGAWRSWTCSKTSARARFEGGSAKVWKAVDIDFLVMHRQERTEFEAMAHLCGCEMSRRLWPQQLVHWNGNGCPLARALCLWEPNRTLPLEEASPHSEEEEALITQSGTGWSTPSPCEAHSSRRLNGRNSSTYRLV